MYNACEWGNYCRVQDTGGSRQVGRRGIVTYAAIAVVPNSEVYTPQQFANRNVGVPFYFGTTTRIAYARRFRASRHDQSMQRAAWLALSARFADQGRNRRDDADGTIHHARGKERFPDRLLRLLITETEVASDKVGRRDLWASIAVREAVARSTRTRRHLQYFIDYHKAKDSEIGTLTVAIAELRLVVVDPAPIPRRKCSAPMTGSRAEHAAGNRVPARTRQFEGAGPRTRHGLRSLVPVNGRQSDSRSNGCKMVGNRPPPSLPGLPRHRSSLQSAFANWMDPRVKPAGDKQRMGKRRGI